MTTTTVVLVLLSITPLVTGHGYIIDPPGRSSMWRSGFNTPINYNDNQLFCGGAYNMNTRNKGKCGVCGDPWQGPKDNEAGGLYATGTIAKTYQTGQSITITVIVTANHMGWFEFKLCPNNNPKKAITRACLDSHVLQRSDGQGSKYYITSATGPFKVQVNLPEGLTCSQCVLQWRWHTGNSWGVNKNGRGCLGCGPQEEFYGCSDIAISNNGNPILTQRPLQVVTTERQLPPFMTLAPFKPVVTERPYQPTTARPYIPITEKPYEPTTQRPQPVETQRPITARPYKPPTNGNKGIRCYAVNNWAGVPSLDRWCVLSCVTGNCPPIYCRCE